MRRYLYLLSPLLVLVSMLYSSYSMAQTVVDAIAEPEKMDIGKYALKMLMTVITLTGSSITPYITKYLTMWVLIGIGKASTVVPGPVLVIISTIISGVFAGVMGATTELPLHGDTAALMGATLGGSAQKFANNESGEVKPTPEAMAKIVNDTTAHV